MTSEELMSTLADDPMERLRWCVLREFNVLPSSDEAKKMSDDDCIRFAAHMLIDKNGASLPNTNFSMEKYMEKTEAENGR